MLDKQTSQGPELPERRQIFPQPFRQKQPLDKLVGGDLTGLRNIVRDMNGLIVLHAATIPPTNTDRVHERMEITHGVPL